MNRRTAVSLAAAFFATSGSVSPALAAPEARRVVVAGAEGDTIADGVQKELTALGFETVRVGALDGCARTAVAVAARDSEATAATCSDGDQIGIWVADAGTLRLRDVVVVREEGDAARETTAVRAAEVTRATIAMRDAEEEAARPPPAPQPKSQPQPLENVQEDRPEASSTPTRTSRAPTFLVSAGISGLLGVDASAAALSTKAEVGVFRHLTAAARLDYPLESPELGAGSPLTVAPAFAGAGIGLPISGTDALIIPRFGAGVGVAWVTATRPEGFSFTGVSPVTTPETSDSTASFAMYADAGLSLRLYRALRMTVDGVFGATTSRLVVRDQGVHAAYWGQPFGALALRLELMIK